MKLCVGIEEKIPEKHINSSSEIISADNGIFLSLNEKISLSTLFESESERQKIEPVPIPLPRASRNFPDVKTRNENFFHNWTSEITPFSRFGMQIDRT